jgi:hypothetical protein
MPEPLTRFWDFLDLIEISLFVVVIGLPECYVLDVRVGFIEMLARGAAMGKEVGVCFGGVKAVG